MTTVYDNPAALAGLITAKSIAHAWRIFTGEAARLGFDMQLYGASILAPKSGWGALTETLILMNGPEPYAETYLSEELFDQSATFEWASKNEGCISWHGSMKQLRVHPSPRYPELYSLHVDSGLVAGYTIGLHDIVPGKPGVVGLSTKGLDDADMDALWAHVGKRMHLLAKTLHLRVASLPNTGIFRPLTSRQVEVLYWYSEGKMLQDIATIMGISIGTVEKHLRCAREALEAETTAHAVRKATSLNLLTA